MMIFARGKKPQPMLLSCRRGSLNVTEFYFLLRAAVQLMVTVIGVFARAPVMFVASGRGMRNRWPSEETSKVFQLPVCPSALFQ